MVWTCCEIVWWWRMTLSVKSLVTLTLAILDIITAYISLSLSDVSLFCGGSQTKLSSAQIANRKLEITTTINEFIDCWKNQQGTSNSQVGYVHRFGLGSTGLCLLVSQNNESHYTPPVVLCA